MPDIIGYGKCVWDSISNPDKTAVIIGLATGWFSLIVSHIIMYLSFRGRLKEKDIRIEDLVEQRNKFQELVLEQRGIERKTTKPKK